MEIRPGLKAARFAAETRERYKRLFGDRLGDRRKRRVMSLTWYIWSALVQALINSMKKPMYEANGCNRYSAITTGCKKMIRLLVQTQSPHSVESSLWLEASCMLLLLIRHGLLIR